MGGNIKKLDPTNSKCKSGDYSKYNPKKYFGARPIWYRSSYELRFMIICETNPNVKSWSSEEISLPYNIQERQKNGRFKKVKRTYNTDFTVFLTNGKKYIIEVKPKSQSPLNKQQINRSPIHYKNARKWLAALEWAKYNGYEFKVITEDHLKTRIF